jgi:hypothetical protein
VTPYSPLRDYQNFVGTHRDSKLQSVLKSEDHVLEGERRLVISLEKQRNWEASTIWSVRVIPSSKH